MPTGLLADGCARRFYDEGPQVSDFDVLGPKSSEGGAARPSGRSPTTTESTSAVLPLTDDIVTEPHGLLPSALGTGILSTAVGGWLGWT